MNKYIVTLSSDRVRDVQINPYLLPLEEDYDTKEEYKRDYDKWEEQWFDYNDDIVVGVYYAGNEKEALDMAMQYLDIDTDESLIIQRLAD